MKAREVRERLKGRCDPEVSLCIEAVAEVQGVLKQEMDMMAKMLDQMTQMMNTMMDVAGNMKDVTDKLQGVRGDEDVGPTV